MLDRWFLSKLDAQGKVIYFLGQVVVVMLIALLVFGGMGATWAEGQGLFILLSIGGVVLWGLGCMMVWPASRDAPRGDADEPPYAGPQLAGSSCAHCQTKIMIQSQGVLCKTCKQPLHRDCRKEHRLSSHAEPPRAAYR